MTGSLKNIWQMLKGQRLRYLAAIIAMLLGSVFSYLIPVVIQIAIDALSLKIDGEIRGESKFIAEFLMYLDEYMGQQHWLAENLWIASLSISAIALLAATFIFLRGLWSTQASEWLAQSLRTRVFDHIQRLPLRYHDDNETGDLIQRCSTDVETVKTFYGMQLAEAINVLILMAVGLPIMFWMNTSMAIVSIVLLPFILSYSILFFLLVKNKFKVAEEAEAKMTSVLQENLDGIRVVRAFSQQASEIERFAVVNEKRRATQMTLYRMFAWFWSTGDFLVMSQMFLIVCFGVYWLQEGTLSVGGFYAFVAWSQLYLWPVRMLGRMLGELGKAQVAIRRLGDIFAEKPEIPEADSTVQKAEDLSGKIVFDGVSFHYHEDADFQLKDVSFTVNAGETVALMGPSGGGKTTLLSLLLRLYDGYEGSITLDGKELKQIEKQSLREQLAVVLQNPFLTSRTIGRNIKLGRSYAKDKEMRQAAHEAAIHESIEDFKDGYSTIVGEKGQTLSGGQKQRVAIARALLQHTPVLIFDDSLSAVDTRTERHILEAIRRAHGHRTVLIVAHRIASLAIADRIIVIKDGQVGQVGTHEELVEADGLYRQLWQTQTAFEAEAKEEVNRRNDPEENAGGVS